MRAVRAVCSVLLFLYPLWVHIALTLGRPQWATYALPVLYVAQRVSGGARRPALLDAVVIMVFVILLGLGHWMGESVLIYLPPIYVSGLLLYLFGRTLRPGREPLVTRFMRLMREPTPETLRYTRIVTWVWTVFFAAMLAESIGLALFAPRPVWSLFCNVLNYLFIAALMLGEYGYRRVHHPASYTFGDMLRRLAHVDLGQLVRK